MKTLEEVQAQFESRNSVGNTVEILAYHKGQEYPIIAQVWSRSRWMPMSYKVDGAPCGETYRARLIKKRPVLPKDILCEVWDSNVKTKCKRYSDGEGRFFPYGSDSITSVFTTLKEEWDCYRVIENEPKPWFGGECPIPDGCELRVLIRGKWHDPKVNQVLFYWERVDHITAYQILGEKESK